MRTTRLPLAAVAAVLALTATACGDGSAADDGSDTIEIGMSISTLNNPFFVELQKGAEAQAEDSEIDLTITDAQNDSATQANQIQNFTSQNMSTIIINPVDSDAAGPSVKAAGNADIPVVAADRAVNGAEVNTTVASDNVQGGELAAEKLAEEMGETGKVVVLRGISGTSASRERGEGFEKGIARFPDIEVVAQQPADFDRAKGLDVMTNLLQANPDVTGVFAENDEMALGAVKALGERAGSTVTVVGFDGTADGLKAVQAGTMAASVAQQPDELGRMAVRNAARLARDEDVDEEIKVPVKIVTKENVESFL
ncbi:hypothetical protein GCM10023347_36610 [Streptomyces chumphonensis]|uniref:Substrate-binding domain-containing protein n=1 Tax=Streptomyces chumphonensis TaxID=1214925 RepID=A0A927EWQ7_9ACTN|nr:substrate-binding domain-containing protein [Streptomyces chumphonensis]